MNGESIEFLVALSQERSDVAGHYAVCALVWLVGCGHMWNFSGFKNFIRFQKFQNQKCV